jgi:hypothetical protein
VVHADDRQVLERDVAGDWIGLLQDIVGDEWRRRQDATLSPEASGQIACRSGPCTKITQLHAP